MGDKRLNMKIKGSVQGVFFRTACRDIAANLMLNGWVKNIDDGTVEVMAEGAEQDLKDLLKWAQEGPENATVDEVKEKWTNSKDAFEDFEIIENALKDADTKAAALKKFDELIEKENEGSDHPVHEPFTKEDKHFKQ